MLRVFPAESATDLELVRELFVEYAGSLEFDLSFQHFDDELASLPGKYGPPSGLILLAEADGNLAGCVALRSLAVGICEMKRLYIRPAYRGSGAGRALAESIIARATALGYARMRLDTVPSMQGAIGLYRRLGFKEIPPYRANPIAGALFMELLLGRDADPD